MLPIAASPRNWDWRPILHQAWMGGTHELSPLTLQGLWCWSSSVAQMGILPAFYGEVRLHEVTFPRSQVEWDVRIQTRWSGSKACTSIALPTSPTFPEDQPAPEC